MKIRPILTEKSMADAGEGRYSFWVPIGLTKNQIRKLVGDTFGVTVKKVRTINYKARVKTSLMRRGKIRVRARKKAIVELAGKEKLEIFGERGKK